MNPGDPKPPVGEREPDLDCMRGKADWEAAGVLFADNIADVIELAWTEDCC